MSIVKSATQIKLHRLECYLSAVLMFDTRDSKSVLAECSSRRRRMTRLGPNLRKICRSLVPSEALPDVAEFASFCVHFRDRKLAKSQRNRPWRARDRTTPHVLCHLTRVHSDMKTRSWNVITRFISFPVAKEYIVIIFHPRSSDPSSARRDDIFHSVGKHEHYSAIFECLFSFEIAVC